VCGIGGAASARCACVLEERGACVRAVKGGGGSRRFRPVAGTFRRWQAVRDLLKSHPSFHHPPLHPTLQSPTPPLPGASPAPIVFPCAVLCVPTPRWLSTAAEAPPHRPRSGSGGDGYDDKPHRRRRSRPPHPATPEGPRGEPAPRDEVAAWAAPRSLPAAASAGAGAEVGAEPRWNDVAAAYSGAGGGGVEGSSEWAQAQGTHADNDVNNNSNNDDNGNDAAVWTADAGGGGVGSIAGVAASSLPVAVYRRPSGSGRAGASGAGARASASASASASTRGGPAVGADSSPEPPTPGIPRVYNHGPDDECVICSCPLARVCQGCADAARGDDRGRRRCLVATGKCGHAFHAHCILGWLSQCDKHLRPFSCPLDKQGECMYVCVWRGGA
jgi:hypothetical protein